MGSYSVIFSYHDNLPSLSDRSARLKEMQERQEELELNNKRLQREEQALREKYQEVNSFVTGGHLGLNG